MDEEDEAMDKYDASDDEDDTQGTKVERAASSNAFEAMRSANVSHNNSSKKEITDNSGTVKTTKSGLVDHYLGIRSRHEEKKRRFTSMNQDPDLEFRRHSQKAGSARIKRRET